MDMRDKAASRSWVWHFEAPPERIWPLLADTARFNEAAGLPKQEIEERAQADGSVRYFGSARKGPVRLEWEEVPVNWVSQRWFRHRRNFTRGPLAMLCATLRIEPEGQDGKAGSKVTYRLDAAPANWLGRLMLAGPFFKAAGRDFGRLAEEAGAYALGRRDSVFDYHAPALPEGAAGRIAEAVSRIEASGHGHGLADRLARFVGTAQEVDLVRLRPLALARQWGVGEREAIELCLEATRAGLLVLRWDLLCPRCRVAKSVVPSLDELPRGAHCATCNIDYGRDFSRNVELSFQPAPAVRPISAGEYCLFGPESTPHIRAHLTLQPGERREEPASLPPGRYRLRSLEPGPEWDLDWEEGGDGFPAVIAEEGAIGPGAPAPPGQLLLENRSDRPLTLIVEERAWARDALTADRVTALQAFRDLFSAQVLRPGDEVSVARVALLFTDLAGSTALYDRVGDAEAYHLVREHFAVLTRAVREHEGAVVKTIGDAVMAAFANPAAAFRTALAIREAVEAFNAERPAEPIRLKVGLHEGPCIAVTLNERLDYFGSTVNMAARLQGQSRAGDIVLSETLAVDPAVAPLLESLPQARERAALKGFEQEVAFRRLAPSKAAPAVA